VRLRRNHMGRPPPPSVEQAVVLGAEPDVDLEQARCLHAHAQALGMTPLKLADSLVSGRLRLAPPTGPAGSSPALGSAPAHAANDEHPVEPDLARGDVLSTRFVLRGWPVLHVVHDRDGHWRAMCDLDTRPGDLVPVRWDQLAASDPDLRQVTDLLPGWQAWRPARHQPWSRRAQ